MVRYHLDLYGIETPHPVDHIVNYHCGQANGANAYVLLCFQTPALILTRNGLEHLKPGDVIIHSPEDIVYHRATEDMQEGFVNDWIHLSSDCMDSLLKETQLPCSVLIRTHNPLFIRNALLDIDLEFAQHRPFYQLHISNFLESTILSIARFYKCQFQEYSAYSEMLYALRQRLLHEYSDKWTIERMAGLLNLSASYFSIQYRKMFNISPIEDLIEIRIQAAKHYLKNTGRSIHEIAVECGFQNEYYFSKTFKKRVGLAPTAFRGKNSAPIHYMPEVNAAALNREHPPRTEK